MGSAGSGTLQEVRRARASGLPEDNEMNTNRFVVMAVACAVVAGAGCSRGNRESTPETTGPQTFSIAETNFVVEASELPSATGQQMVRADFNFDKLEDVAITEEDESGQSVVSIYLRKQSDELRELYYRAGGIHLVGDYKVSALMSAGGKDYTDLLVMFNFPDGRKEMVHFRSSGTEFTEVLRKTVGTAAGGDEQP
jgi:hypothetical protein